LGAAVPAIGLALLAPTLQPGQAALIQYLAVAFLIVGVAFWGWLLYMRAVDPAGFARGAMPAWLFIAYTVLTNVGLMTFGAALLVAGYPVWLGALAVAGGLIFLAAFLIFKDLPPFVYYVLLLVAGVALAF
jgi:hypothetical protein